MDSRPGIPVATDCELQQSIIPQGIFPMEFNDLIADFAARHAVSGLSAEDSAAVLDIDGIPVTLVEAAGYLVATAEIGDPPAEGRADFADILLEANLENPAFFAKTRETGKYVLIRRVSLAGLDSDAFDAALESLVNAAETWSRLLADFRPAAKAAAEADSVPPAFGTSGFLQV